MNVKLFLIKETPVSPWEIVSIMVAVLPHEVLALFVVADNFECFLNKVAGKVANVLTIQKKNSDIKFSERFEFVGKNCFSASWFY